jgi:DNA-binding NarL/FixJ family response regulator
MKERGSKLSSIHVPEPIQIGLVTPEPMWREGFRSIFEQPAQQGQPPFKLVTGSTGELLARSTIEYLIVHLTTPEEGLEALAAVRRAHPPIRTIIIGPETHDEAILELIIAGARAYLDLTANLHTVREAIHTVTCGSIWASHRLLSKLVDRLLKVSDTNLAPSDPHLTEREHQVLELLLLARSNREIAEQLGIEERTVKSHVGRLMRKTGAENRIELSMRALNRPIVPRTKIYPRRSHAPAHQPVLDGWVI